MLRQADALCKVRDGRLRLCDLWKFGSALPAIPIPIGVGGFYPAGTKATQMLAYYSRQFPLVELQFHLLPSAILRTCSTSSPCGRRRGSILVKLPCTISHENRKDDIDGFRLAALLLQKQDRLSGLLLQLP